MLANLVGLLPLALRFLIVALASMLALLGVGAAFMHDDKTARNILLACIAVMAVSVWTCMVW